MSPLRPVLASVLALGLTGCARAGTPSSNPASQAQAVEWAAWGIEPFERAEASRKLVLVDVGIEGCTACRWMDELTYTDPDVTALLREHFVTVSVDAEAQPEVGERYSAWGWPATIVLTPAGERVMALRGNKLPRNFIPILQQLIEAQQQGTLESTRFGAYEAAPADADLAERRDALVERLDARFDEASGGWSRKLKAPMGPNVEHALLRAHARGHGGWRERALTTVAGYAQLLDPVWGGVFVGGIGGWSKPIPEKRTESQSQALANFAQAYALTRDATWLDAAGGVRTYLEGTMLDTGGGFYSTQEDVAPGLPKDMDASDYFALTSAEARLEFGTPPIDKAIYTDKNAAVISAYVALYEASGDATALDVAVRAASLLLTQQREDGLFEQLADASRIERGQRMRSLPASAQAFLQPQGPMGMALLDLHRATADPRYLDAAKALGAGLATLEDPEAGGFFATTASEVDRVIPRRKPLTPNAQAARFLVELSLYTGDEADRARARAAVLAVSTDAQVKQEGAYIGELVLAMEALLDPGIEFTVVGLADDPNAQALYQAALELYEPRKVVHYDVLGKYPARERPTMYICTESACSSPIEQPKKIAAAAEAFAAKSTP